MFLMKNWLILFCFFEDRRSNHRRLEVQKICLIWDYFCNLKSLFLLPCVLLCNVILSTWHYANLLFGLLDISQTCIYDNMLFCHKSFCSIVFYCVTSLRQLDIMSTCFSVYLTSHKLAFRTTCCFVRNIFVPVCFIVQLHCVNLTLCQLAFWSTWHLINLHIGQHADLSKVFLFNCVLLCNVIASTWHYVNLLFGLLDIS